MQEWSQIDRRTEPCLRVIIFHFGMKLKILKEQLTNPYNQPYNELHDNWA
jgi:hypothetical protein